MTVTTRRERRQQQRRKEQRRSTGSGGGSGGVSQMWIAIGVVIGLVALVLVARAAGVFEPPATSNTDINAVDASGPTLGQHMDDLGNAHVPSGQSGSYTSLPPTSGEHWASPAGPAPWGIKSTWLRFEVTTHNLEHGGIVIVYRDLTNDQLQQLQSLVRDLGSNGFNKIILEPYPELKDAKIALTAWNWILKLQAPDDASVVKFVRQHYDGEAPEKGVP
jgi:hypothetical protein